MRRLLSVTALAVTVLATCGPGVFAPSVATPSRSLIVTGTGVEMYPAFDPAISRYAVTTTSLTGGTLDVAATPGPDESVTINGGSATHLTGLQPNDQVTVAFSGGSSPHTYKVIYLPEEFPKLTVTTGAAGSFQDLEPGLVALTLNAFDNTVPPFDAIVDRNGVPAWAEPDDHTSIDLKQQPTGEVSISRPTTVPGNTGVSLVVLDRHLAEASRHDVVAPLTNTDGHDSVRLPDGSTILIGYEWNPVTSMTDATIQKVDANGNETFRWTSAPFAGETVADAATQTTLGLTGDYAHINSVVSVENGDIIASFRHLSAAYRIATVAHDGYQSGDVVWKLGGRHSDFTFVNDPLPSGPCAQHTVSELPNGHILIFDNGTDGLCVDPTDPTGPGIARHQTRITEYALDTVAHTATLVWSYAPSGKYSLFAGSARRMANGNTLVDWASDRNALTTEVSANQDVLWQLSTPATDAFNAKRYLSYRAELITALRPAVTLSGPADGTSIIQGTATPAAASCTDWRGDALDDCTVTGATGGLLDTSAPGAYTWQVTAEDGAGNTTTVVRHFTVRPPARLADGSVRKAGGTWWKGAGVVGAPTTQTVRERVRRTHPAVAHWRIANAGERADAFRLVGTGSNRRFGVRYVSGGVDVTAAVVAGTFRAPTLAPGQSVTLRVVVTPTRRAPAGRTRTISLTAVSVGDPTRVDRVATSVTVRR